jgi:penicillin-binding protein A
MTDLMDRLAEADPVREHDRPPIDEIWRKIADEPAPRGRRAPPRRWGAALALMAAVAVPVAAVIVIALPGHEPDRARPHPAVAGRRGSHSTIDPAIQRAARQALGARAGTIVIMNPRTGTIEAMAHAGTGRAGTPIPPGATFDLVTAEAAIGSGRYGPRSRISGASPFGQGASQVRNNEDQSFGEITLTDALTMSVNTVFARLGTTVGARVLAGAMRAFRFYIPTLAGTPASGASAAGRLVQPTDRRVLLGPLAAGQSSLLVTPLQLALEAAAVADNGWMQVPRVTDPGPLGRWPVMSARTALTLRRMLRRVVSHGTATAADVPGLDVAGLTGTAPAGGADPRATVASFLGFAPAAHPTVAIAVVVTDPKGGFGGTVAAPIAARLLRDALRSPR